MSGTDPRLKAGAAPWATPPWIPAAVALAVAALLPWMLDRMERGNFYLHLLITFFAWGMVAQSWNLIMGVSGIYSFGQLAIYAVGGFTTGALAKELGWSPWFTIWLAPVAAVLAALLIGLPTLRLRGVYVVLLTIAFHELLRHFVTNGPQVISNGGFGLLYVPKMGFDAWFGGGRELVFTYYFGLILFAAATATIWRIFHSPIGMAFMALRDAESYAVSRGIDPFRFKLLLFAVSAFFTGLAGGFMTHYQGTASPSTLSFGVMTNLLAMIVLGGWGTFWGPILGAAFLILIDETLVAALQGLTDKAGTWKMLGLGLVMAVIAVLAPRGLFAAVADLVRRPSRPPDRSAP